MGGHNCHDTDAGGDDTLAGGDDTISESEKLSCMRSQWLALDDSFHKNNFVSYLTGLLFMFSQDGSFIATIETMPSMMARIMFSPSSKLSC